MPQQIGSYRVVFSHHFVWHQEQFPTFSADRRLDTLVLTLLHFFMRYWARMWLSKLVSIVESPYAFLPGFRQIHLVLISTKIYYAAASHAIRLSDAIGKKYISGGICSRRLVRCKWPHANETSRLMMMIECKVMSCQQN